MSAYDTFKAGVLGNPYDANKKPSRALTVQGFGELFNIVKETGRVFVPSYGNTFDSAQINAAIQDAEGKYLDFGDGHTYVCDAPILIGDFNLKPNPLGLMGRSEIEFTHEQTISNLGFSNPEVKQSGFNCFFNPESNIIFDIFDLNLKYTGTFDTGGSNTGLINGFSIYGAVGGAVRDASAIGFSACGLFIGGAGSKTGGGSYNGIDTRKITVSNCNFSGNRIGGVETGNSEFISVISNVLERNGLSGDIGTGYGFAILSGSPSNSVFVGGNFANYNFRKGIDTHDGKNINICYNQCKGNVVYGIYASRYTNGTVVISDNIVSDMTISDDGLTGYGIYFGQDTLSGDGLISIVEGNSVTDCTQEGTGVFHPFWCRGGGKNSFNMGINVVDCDTITHFMGGDNVGDSAESSFHISDLSFKAADLKSYAFRLYKENLLDLKFVNSVVEIDNAYSFNNLIQVEAGVAPANAAISSRIVKGNIFKSASAVNFFDFFSENALESENFLRGEMLSPVPEYTIANGVITVGDFDVFISIDTENDVASDTLDTITDGVRNGQILIVKAASSSRTVILSDGTGNLALNGDFSLTQGNDRITLVWNASNAAWAEMSRSDNNI